MLSSPLPEVLFNMLTMGFVPLDLWPEILGRS